MDPKTSLQEAAARLDAGVPVYAIAESGPDHSKVFVASVAIGGDALGSGSGRSKKAAEQAAAGAAMDALSLGDAR